MAPSAVSLASSQSIGPSARLASGRQCQASVCRQKIKLFQKVNN
jgi:hypothetical protein